VELDAYPLELVGVLVPDSCLEESLKVCGLSGSWLCSALSMKVSPRYICVCFCQVFQGLLERFSSSFLLSMA
jgi:hypothetical protein